MVDWIFQLEVIRLGSTGGGSILGGLLGGNGGNEDDEEGYEEYEEYDEEDNED